MNKISREEELKRSELKALKIARGWGHANQQQSVDALILNGVIPKIECENPVSFVIEKCIEDAHWIPDGNGKFLQGCPDLVAAWRIAGYGNSSLDAQILTLSAELGEL